MEESIICPSQGLTLDWAGLVQRGLITVYCDHSPRRNNTLTALALSNLAARDKVSAAHIHITRHLPLQGARLNELAAMAGMSKQAMGDLVNQCVAWGVVRREDDEADARAKRIVFTETGLSWLKAFEAATAQTEEEFRQEVGADVATVVSLGLEAYAADWR